MQLAIDEIASLRGRYRQIFNTVRPHEALDMHRPQEGGRARLLWPIPAGYEDPND